jgi:hypothetical protein
MSDRRPTVEESAMSEIVCRHVGRCDSRPVRRTGTTHPGPHHAWSRGSLRHPAAPRHQLRRGRRGGGVIEVIRGHQRSSAEMRETRRRRTLLRRKDGSSEVIRGHQRPSEATGCHQRSSEATRCHQVRGGGGHAFERVRRTVALSGEAGHARGYARCNLARQIARRVLVLCRERPPNRTHGQDPSGSAPMGSSGVIISHQGSSGVIAHLRTQRQKGGITPCRKSLRQSA